jgi:methylated-DNA-[protein]-cysteine S-methyltransferase
MKIFIIPAFSGHSQGVPMQTLFYHEFETTVGILKLFATDAALVGITWQHEPIKPAWVQATKKSTHPLLQKAAQQLTQYFEKKRTSFDLPLTFNGTPFQQAVWQALLNINHGATTSYAQIAHAIGNPKAVRAVGTAIGANPLPIVVPCHRVIGSNGSLCGFAGGLATKKLLLHLESHGNQSL